ncbi:hypothetical protein [Streptomyces sp. NPDC051109]|uniref:hypothetical protein n=1 Tax=Streptomyces sp. NPDC051109 TaxID=3365642 RepID=UPI00378CD444
MIVQEIRQHLDTYAEAGADRRVFAGVKGATPAVAEGLPGSRDQGLHFHDLRHTGNTLAASTGASTRELMARMGHSTAGAAVIYQHASADRDWLIADALSKLVWGARKGTRKGKRHAGLIAGPGND